MSFSNPARQSLYTYDDCLSGETLKVTASAAAMAKIDPGVVKLLPIEHCLIHVASRRIRVDDPNAGSSQFIYRI